MRHFVCLPLFVALFALPISCDAKKQETPVPQQPAPAPSGKIEGSLDFPETPVGESATKSFNIKNTGTAPLAVTAISYPEGFSGADKPATIEPAGTLGVSVKFSPSKHGPFEGVVAVATNGGKLEVPATGSGSKELSGVLELSKETSFDKVDVGDKANGALVLRNSGNAPLTITAISLPEGFAGNFTGSIEPGQEQKVPVVFSPRESKPYSGQVTVNLSIGRGTTSLVISGVGTAPPPAPRGMATVVAGQLPTGSALVGQEVQAFHIGTHEVTWGEWNALREFALKNGYDIPAAPQRASTNRPVRNISWHDAVKFCNARSQAENLQPVYAVNGEIYRTGQAKPEANPAANGYRLPTEAEWEWAARGGAKSGNSRFSGGEDIGTVAWTWENSAASGEDLVDGRGTAPVGTKKPNELGICDMSGNVAEWCWDEADAGSRRLRGGAWFGSLNDCEVTRRSFNAPENKFDFLGFRMARNLADSALLAQQPPAEPSLDFSTTNKLPDATTGVDYAAKIELTGGKAPYAVTLKPGTKIPEGLEFENGEIKGKPKAAGDFTIPLIATDSSNPAKNSLEREFVLRVSPYGLAIDSEPAAISAKYNEPLSVAFVAQGGAAPYRWSVVGDLPQGLTLNAKLGELSGKPLTAGAAAIVLRVRDAKGFVAFRSIPMTVTATPVEITPEPEKCPAANERMEFSWNFALKGGVPPYSVKLADGSTMPKGLVISTTGSTAGISGTPAEAGNFHLTLEASDSSKTTASLPIELPVAPYGLAITEPPAEQLSGNYLENYTITFNATGGRPPYYWAVEGKVPPGLSVKALTGTLSGKPTAAGKFPVTVKVSDVNDIIVSRNATIEITTAPLSLSPESSEPPAGIAGLAYNWNITIAGGVPPYSLKPVAETNLPKGLVASVSGSFAKLSGKPAAIGTFPISLEATDSSVEKVTLQASLTIGAYDLAIAPESTKNLSGKFKQPLDLPLTATGGKPPYVWSVSGKLPSGVWASGSPGKISGSPYTTGEFPISLKVTDANKLSATADATLIITAEPLQILPDSRENAEATAGLNFRRSFTIQGGVPPYSLKLKDGESLPTGLLLEFTGTKGAITGVFTEATDFSASLTATDSRGQSAEIKIGVPVKPYDLEISETLGQSIIAKYDQPLAATISAKGGKEPYVWKIEGYLPAGVLFQLKTGALTGKPQSIGEFPVTFKVTDANRISATRNGKIVVTAEELKILTPDLPVGKIGVPYSQKIETSGGVAPVTLGIEPGTTPAPGLSLGAAGLLGTPKETGSYPIRIVAMDSKMSSTLKDFTIVIEDSNPAPTPTPTPTPQPTPQATPTPSPTTEAKPAAQTPTAATAPTGPRISVKGGELPVTSPLGKLTVQSFEIDRTEVTLGDWKKIQSQAESRGYDLSQSGSAPGDDHPVANVSWFDAVKWCNLRSELEGLQPAYVINGAVYKTGEANPSIAPEANGYRLPTEPEWEWAARGGAASQGNSYSGANDPDSVAWYASNSGNEKTKPVAGKKPNELGVYDMSGNVREWVWDAHKTYRRVRGGGASDQSFDCSVSVSDFNYPNSRTPDTGFRTVKNPVK